MAETLGSRIRQARDRYGMSQATLARRIGISGTALNQIESGKTPDPGVSRIVGIARVLGVSTDSLLLGDQDGDVAPPAPAKRPRTRKAASVG
jgi:transcriptional regulator with XRE-family HTH domain